MKGVKVYETQKVATALNRKWNNFEKKLQFSSKISVKKPFMFGYNRL